MIIDTAGRLGIDETLMTQARNMRDAVNPDEVRFVIDSMIGQDAVQTADHLEARSLAAGLVPGLNREQLAAAGYLAGWRLVRVLPEKWAMGVNQ